MIALRQNSCLVGLVGMALVGLSQAGSAQTFNGAWEGPYNWGVMPIHMTLLPNKKLLVWNRHRSSVDFQIGISAPPYTSATLPSAWEGHNFTHTHGDIFCSGHGVLWDGKLLTVAGHIADDNGSKDLNSYQWASSGNGTWTSLPDLTSNGRWYPSVTPLPDRRVLIFAGTYKDGSPDPKVETRPTLWGNMFPTTSGTHQAWLAGDFPSGATQPRIWRFYPFTFVDPWDGNIFYTGPLREGSMTGGIDSRLNLATLEDQTYGPFASLNNVERFYASAAYVNGIVVKSGGAELNESQSDRGPDYQGIRKTLYVDLYVAPNSNGSRSWTQGPDMVYGRRNHTLVVLPTGDVLAMGGNLNSTFDKNEFPESERITERTRPELWRSDVPTTAWRLLAQQPSGSQIQRGYHSTSLLLPNGKVIIGGGEQPGLDGGDNFDARRVQIFSPPYANNANWESVRPTITNLTDGHVIRYGDNFTLNVNFSGGKALKDVVLVSLGSTTHGFNMTQRMHRLTYTGSLGSYTVTPPTRNQMPPGWYMLFAVDNEAAAGGGTIGIPSEAVMVQLRDLEPFQVQSMTVTEGSFQTSNPPLDTLYLADNVYAGFWINSTNSQVATLEIEGTAPGTSQSALRLSYEYKALYGATYYATSAQVQFWNWSTSAWSTPQIGMNSTAERRYEANLTSNVGNFVRSSDRRVRARIKWTKAYPELDTDFDVYVDMLEFGVKP